MAIVELWLVIASQWRPPVAIGDGRIFATGLDYSGVRNGLALARRRITPAQWAGVQVMERAATNALNGFAG